MFSIGERACQNGQALVAATVGRTHGRTHRLSPDRLGNECLDDLDAPSLQSYLCSRNAPYSLNDPCNWLRSQQMPAPSERTTPHRKPDIQRIFGPTGASVRLPVLIGPVMGRNVPSPGRVGQLPGNRARLRCLLAVEMLARTGFPSIWNRPGAGCSRVTDACTAASRCRASQTERSDRGRLCIVSAAPNTKPGWVFVATFGP